MARKFDEQSVSMPVCATAETLGIESDEDLRVLYALADMYAADMWRRKRTYAGMDRQAVQRFMQRNGSAFYDRMCSLLARNLLRSVKWARERAACGS